MLLIVIKTYINLYFSRRFRSIRFQDNSRSELASDETNWSDNTGTGGSRPTRQCINRSIPYRYIQEDDDDDE